MLGIVNKNKQIDVEDDEALKNESCGTSVKQAAILRASNAMIFKMASVFSP